MEETCILYNNVAANEIHKSTQRHYYKCSIKGTLNEKENSKRV